MAKCGEKGLEKGYNKNQSERKHRGKIWGERDRKRELDTNERREGG